MSLPENNFEAIFDILGEIHKEREAQDAKFGDQTVKGIPKWHAILGEEAGEVFKEICEILHGGGSLTNLRVELIQVGAVAAAFVQYGDLNGWWRQEFPKGT